MDTRRPVDDGRPRVARGMSARRFAQLCRNLLEEEEVQAQLQAVLKNSAHPAYAQVWKNVAAYGYGRPTERKQVTKTMEFRIRDERNLLREPEDPALLEAGEAGQVDDAVPTLREDITRLVEAARKAAVTGVEVSGSPQLEATPSAVAPSADASTPVSLNGGEPT